VIGGLGRFPALIHRWEYFAQWLQVPWVCSIRYEDVLEKPQACAERIFRQAMERSARTFDRRVSFEPLGLETLTRVMASATRQHDRSPTFRKGVAGAWRELFTAEQVALWKALDSEHWLERLGYEKGEWYG
jgi:hypothetical protein